jgi:molybdopterin synthase catalytic subunit
LFNGPRPSRPSGDTYKPPAAIHPNMKVIGVVGPSDAGKTTLVGRLVERLDGRVGSVKHGHGFDVDRDGKDTARHRAAGAATTYGVADGEWFATGDEMTLDDVLARLAVDHDHAVVEGYSDVDLPQVVLGGRDHAGEALATGATADDVDVDAVVDAVADLDAFETLGSLVARAKRSEGAERAGAIATFTGCVRARDGPDDTPTEHLEFEKYDAVADERMDRLERELAERDGVRRVLVHHRTGVVEAGEDIVFVVVLAGHRGEAFETVEDGIDRLKDEVPLFKKEVTVEETFWRHERD